MTRGPVKRAPSSRPGIFNGFEGTGAGENLLGRTNPGRRRTKGTGKEQSWAGFADSCLGHDATSGCLVTGPGPSQTLARSPGWAWHRSRGKEAQEGKKPKKHDKGEGTLVGAFDLTIPRTCRRSAGVLQRREILNNQVLSMHPHCEGQPAAVESEVSVGAA